MYQQPWNNGYQNNGYYDQYYRQQQQAGQEPYFSAQNYQTPGFAQQAQQGATPAEGGSSLPIEQSFIENILRLNRGKNVIVHQTFEGNDEWRSRVFRGRLEEAGRDHIIVSNPETGEYYLLLMVNLDWVTFDEQINYSYPFGQQSSQDLGTYSPR
ncbi:spore coat protein GerQ [Alkalicoccobacillus porphyridii]|uniref:Spore coat protein GerQ n=1 Tax=Alkalicoccobacillus porphyridii TaxID=2597270 RepID=A0A553ZU35_9BACI|nr:spore coat protein GerQ [Alkalicoccobacillus porphyridii]TSB44988.1 spore coat protein GerQ [Alkalicoccobacillus porphyridii]